MSSNDAYQEFELYLQQVNDEIMQVFENWNTSYNLKSLESENGILKKTNPSQNEEWEGDIMSLQSYDSDLKERSLSCNGESNENYESERISNGEQVPINCAEYTSCSCCHLVNKLTTNWNCKGSMSSNGYPMDTVECNGNIKYASAISNYAYYPENPNLSSLLTILSNREVALNGNDLHTFMWLYWKHWESNHRFDCFNMPFLKKMTVKVNKQTCSQLDRHLAEIEAVEACKWLRAAGFPQYAQMYEENQFPVDITAAQHDHPLLEPIVLQSLFRRLHTLNQCARMCQQPSTHVDDSEDEQCALSDNWTYQKDLRRWSRNIQADELSNLQANFQKENEPDDVNSGDSKSTSNNNAIVYPEKLEIKKFTFSNEHKLVRRATSTKFPHHRDGIIMTVDDIANTSLKRLGSVKHVDEIYFSNLEHTANKAKAQDLKEILNSECLQMSPKTKEGKSWSHLQAIDQVIKEEVLQEHSGQPIISLSCTQLQILRKLALLKLTAHIEKYCPSHRTGWNWELPKFIKKIRNSSYKENQLLNLPLTTVLQRTGQPLPKGIQEALEWLHLNESDQVGLFRKPGVRSRIQALKTLVETQGENINFNDQQAYDVADMVKQYFRELPEPVLTNKLSETFILIFQYVPPYLRKEMVLCTLLLMPDEHREVLQALIHFLLKIAKHSQVNQMNDSNLAICFAPTLFQCNNHSLFYKQSLTASNPRELIEIKAAQECLLYMLRNNEEVFNVPQELLNQCKLSEISGSVAVQLSELGSNIEGGWQGYMHECHLALLREVREKNRGWLMVSTVYSKLELSYKKVVDGHPLRLWKVAADIEAPPTEVLHRILRERHIWDDDLHSAKIIAQLNKHSEIFHYVRRNIVPLLYVDYCVVRTWNAELPRGTCAIVETSVEHSDVPDIPNTVRGIVLASRYLIEPGGSGKSRVLHLSRVDMRGRMPDWYHKNYGHLCAIHIAKIQDSFHQNATGPESKV